MMFLMEKINIIFQILSLLCAVVLAFFRKFEMATYMMTWAILMEIQRQGGK